MLVKHQPSQNLLPARRSQGDALNDVYITVVEDDASDVEPTPASKNGRVARLNVRAPS